MVLTHSNGGPPLAVSGMNTEIVALVSVYAHSRSHHRRSRCHPLRSAEHVGKTRYSVRAGASFFEVCMQKGADVYVWATLATEVI